MEEKEKLRQQGDTGSRERTRLKNTIEEKNQELEKVKRDQEVHISRIEDMRREVRAPLRLIFLRLISTRRIL